MKITYYANRLRPVISAGAASPMALSNVGAISQSAPSLITERPPGIGTVHEDERHLRSGMRRMRRSVICDHLVAVAVIGRYERESAFAANGVDDLAHAGIHRLNGGDGGGDDARVADHIGVREVHDVHIGLVGIDRCGQACPRPQARSSRAADRTWQPWGWG